MSLTVVMTYFVLGSLAGIAYLISYPADQRRTVTAVQIILFWPLLGPAAFLGKSEKPLQPSRTRLESELDAAWDKLPDEVFGPTERAMVLDFARRVSVLELRLREMKEAQKAAPQSVQKTLAEMEAKAQLEWQQAVELIGEIQGQLTLLRFIDGPQPNGPDRARIEALLEAIGTLTQGDDHLRAVLS